MDFSSQEIKSTILIVGGGEEEGCLACAASKLGGSGSLAQGKGMNVILPFSEPQAAQ